MLDMKITYKKVDKYNNINNPTIETVITLVPCVNPNITNSLFINITKFKCIYFNGASNLTNF